MKTFELFGWHIYLGRRDANGKTKALLIEGVKDEKPKARGKCPECGKWFYPLAHTESPSHVRFRLPNNWCETGNILIMLDCPHCNWCGEGWFTLVEVRP